MTYNDESTPYNMSKELSIKTEVRNLEVAEEDTDVVAAQRKKGKRDHSKKDISLKCEKCKKNVLFGEEFAKTQETHKVHR